MGARTPQAWSSALQAAISGVTGDDAAMATMGVGTDLKGFQSLLAPRLAELESTAIGPLDRLRREVAEAEQALQQARVRHEAETAALWAGYQVAYERHLRPEPEEPEDDELVRDELLPPEPTAGEAEGEPSGSAEAAPEGGTNQDRAAEP